MTSLRFLSTLALVVAVFLVVKTGWILRSSDRSTSHLILVATSYPDKAWHSVRSKHPSIHESGFVLTAYWNETKIWQARKD